MYDMVKTKPEPPLDKIKNAVLSTYGHMIRSKTRPEEFITFRQVEAEGDGFWRVEFHVELGHRQNVSGAVFKGSDGRYYIDDSRNSRGTSVFQNVDGFFR